MNLTIFVKKTNFSRLPVWDKNPENIIGVILVKDLLKINNSLTTD